MDTDSGSEFKKGKLAHKARSVPLLSLQDPDLAAPLNADAIGWIRIPDQDSRRENGLIIHKARSVPLPIVQSPDSAASLDPDSGSGFKKGKLAHKARSVPLRFYRFRVQLCH